MKAQPCLPKAPGRKELRDRLIRDGRGAEERPDDGPDPDNEALFRHTGWQLLECTGQITKCCELAQTATTSCVM